MTRIIDKNTAVSIGFILSVVGGAAWISSWMTRVESRLEVIEVSISAENGPMGDRWRAYDMRMWADSLEAMNPDLHVPVVREPPK